MAGYIVYEGPSRIDGAPIVVIVTGLGPKSERSKNDKTGEMAQVWILRADVSPTDAINTGDDESICGDCPLRGLLEDGANRFRACYVSVRNAPLAVWNAYQAGSYEYLTDETWLDQSTRLGAYGDPAAVPVPVLRDLVRRGTGHTGYTHQWRQRKFRFLRNLVMASADSLDDKREAQAAGWRTFRSLEDGEEMDQTEIYCPSDRGIQCADCGACDGSREQENFVPLRRSVAIYAYGSPAVMGSYGRMRERRTA